MVILLLSPVNDMFMAIKKRREKRRKRESANAKQTWQMMLASKGDNKDLLQFPNEASAFCANMLFLRDDSISLDKDSCDSI